MLGKDEVSFAFQNETRQNSHRLCSFPQDQRQDSSRSRNRDFKPGMNHAKKEILRLNMSPGDREVV